MHYYSPLIPIRPGAIYRISCDQKAPPHSTSKVFIKGYAMLPPMGSGKPVHREVWRSYMQCRNSSGHWKNFSMDFQIPAKLKPAVRYTPQGKARTYPVRLRWIRVILYAYWPVGQYYFDNVQLQRYSPSDLADKNGDKQVKSHNNNSHPANDRNKQ